jgi:RNA polymerase sigma-70 factor (ECF subfamily)
MVKITVGRLAKDGFRRRRLNVNGQPGQMTINPDGEVTDVLTVEVGDGLIRTIRIVRNPDKLRHLRA